VGGDAPGPAVEFGWFVGKVVLFPVDAVVASLYDHFIARGGHDGKDAVTVGDMEGGNRAENMVEAKVWKKMVPQPHYLQQKKCSTGNCEKKFQNKGCLSGSRGRKAAHHERFVV